MSYSKREVLNRARKIHMLHIMTSGHKSTMQGGDGMLANVWRQPEAVGNIGVVWPPGITGVTVYGSLPAGVHFIGPVHGYHQVPYHMIAPMYLGFTSFGMYGYF